jgi:fibronectin-binding autotransporter adhesin
MKSRLGSIVNNANLIYSYGTSVNMILPSSTYSGNGNLTASSGGVLFSGDINLGSGTFTLNGNGSITSGNSTSCPSATITAASATINGYVYCNQTNTATLTIDTSATNGALSLNNMTSGWDQILYGYNNLVFNSGSGALSITGATRFSTWAANAIFTFTGALQGSGTFGIGNKLVGTPTLVFNPTATSTLSGVISGGLNLIKGGSSTLTLSGANTYTGATTVSTGTLALTNTYASPSYSIASGATLELNYSTTTSTRDYGTGTTFSGEGTLRKTGSGTILWGTSATTFAMSAGSQIDVQGGTLVGGSYSNEVWTNNKSALNVGSGASFYTVEATVNVDALTGEGTVYSAYNTSSNANAGLVVGVANGSGTFSSVASSSFFASSGLIRKSIAPFRNPLATSCTSLAPLIKIKGR